MIQNIKMDKTCNQKAIGKKEYFCYMENQKKGFSKAKDIQDFISDHELLELENHLKEIEKEILEYKGWLEKNKGWLEKNKQNGENLDSIIQFFLTQNKNAVNNQFNQNSKQIYEMYFGILEYIALSKLFEYRKTLIINSITTTDFRNLIIPHDEQKGINPGLLSKINIDNFLKSLLENNIQATQKYNEIAKNTKEMEEKNDSITKILYKHEEFAKNYNNCLDEIKTSRIKFLHMLLFHLKDLENDQGNPFVFFGRIFFLAFDLELKKRKVKRITIMIIIFIILCLAILFGYSFLESLNSNADMENKLEIELLKLEDNNQFKEDLEIKDDISLKNTSGNLFVIQEEDEDYEDDEDDENY